ncbi:MAG: hypothetical protein RL213_1766 [Bacteroidota bacterium]|jgi:hypothetical protein
MRLSRLLPIYLALLLVHGSKGQPAVLQWDVSRANIRANACRFYVGDIILFKDHTEVCRIPPPRLIDLSEGTAALPVSPECPGDFNRIVFSLGIDSLTNAGGVMGGDLDPANGMYWTWQSGYINFKLETDSPAKRFHIGGYRRPYDSLRKVDLVLPEGKNSIITFDIDRFLESVPDTVPSDVMSPGPNACLLADRIVAAFITNKR